MKDTLMNSTKNRTGRPKAVTAATDTAVDRPSADKLQLPTPSAPIITTPAAPIAAPPPRPSIWSDPATVVGIAFFLGKICRQTALPFPNSLLRLLYKHAGQHDFACQLTIVWLKKNAVIADLLPPSNTKERADA